MPISIRKISSLQIKKCFRQGCHLYAAHVEDTTKCKSLSIEDFPMLQEFTDVFPEIPGSPPKRDIDFSIDLVPGATPISKYI